MRGSLQGSAGVYRLPIQLGISKRARVLDRFEMREDRGMKQCRAKFSLDLLRQVVSMPDGPVARDQDVDGDEHAPTGTAGPQRVELNFGSRESV
jgi:hypothetical protein